jgi:predicted hotdog family 3-hydroxylacyl-ACP dehydratase
MPEDLPPIADLVPHSGPMCLLSRLLAADTQHLITEVVVPVSGLFSRPSGVGAWVGIEYMAQTVAAWAGWQSRAAGQAPRIGLLLGTRRYCCTVSRFEPGQVLHVEIEPSFQADNGLGQFDCRITCAGAELARAKLTVFEPADATAFLQGESP